MPKEETLKYYESKVKDIVRYIQNNLDKDLNVKTLAERSNISFFHFHRIIKACLGMPLGMYINSLRLDTAAKIIKYSSESINEIAIKIGYSDLSAFSKSFTREFGISPSEYRQNSESFINSNIDFQLKHNVVEKYNFNPKIKVVPVRLVAYAAVKGAYGGPELYKAWNSILEYATTNKIISWNPEIFTIYYDDPDIVGIDNCTFDICFTLKKNFIPSDLIKIKQVEGGKYLVFRYKGPYENLWDVYNLIFQDYIIKSDSYQLRDMPIFENYLKYSDKTKPGNQITEIYLPIE